MTNASMCDRPLAAPGLISFRCRSPYGGWIMIGANNPDEAMSEALRSSQTASRDTLQIWNGYRYVPV
ncbi:hypothetical protein ABE527_02405 [Brucella sp. TWI432]